MNPEPSLPSAESRPRRPWSYLWLLPIACVAIAGWLLFSALAQRGIPISIQFQQGYGLKPGDTLRYRGINVGSVEEVLLAADLHNITVKLRLDPTAKDLARKGSRFWVVRPQLNLSNVTGLDTVVGANYLSVLPGDGESQQDFIGQDRPPPPEVLEPGGLEIVLTTPGRGNLQAGIPVSYRQVIIGTVASVDLARDGSTVETRLYIKPSYRSLIRENSKFWKASGTRLNLGFTGVSLDVDSMRSLLLGGINLAIPPNPGKPVTTGHRFTLYEESDSDWLEWRPSLSLDGTKPSENRPHPLSVTLRWQYKNLIQFTQDEQRQAWVLPIAGGLLGPADVLSMPSNALPDSTDLTLDDIPIPFSEPAKTLEDGLVILPYAHGYPIWPTLRFITVPEDAVIITNSDESARFIGANRYQTEDPLWRVDSDLPFDASWHGACVVSEKDGALIGMLLVTEDGARVARLKDLAD